MSIEKLLQQKEALEQKIKAHQRVQKLKPKFEKIAVDLIEEHSDILLTDPKNFGKKLDQFLADFVGQIENRQQ